MPFQNSLLLNRSVIEYSHSYFKIALIILVSVANFINLSRIGLYLCEVYLIYTVPCKDIQPYVKLYCNSNDHDISLGETAIASKV